MIFPQQTVLPLEFPDESIDTLTESIPDLGPLHLHICNGIEFTSCHQLPVVKAVHVDAPENMKAFYRIKKAEQGQSSFGHFYMADKKFERVWNRPFSYIGMFKQLGAIISPDFSILTNMLEAQRRWNDFRNKLLSAFYQKWGVTVVSSPSWSNDLRNIGIYMEGWPCNSTIAINSTGVCMDKKARTIWLDGYHAMIDILKPCHILRYGGYIEGEIKGISTYYVNNNRIY